MNLLSKKIFVDKFDFMDEFTFVGNNPSLIKKILVMPTSRAYLCLL